MSASPRAKPSSAPILKLPASTRVPTGIVARRASTSRASTSQPAKLVGWKLRDAACSRSAGTDAAT
jgi:hypothetical protein